MRESRSSRTDVQSRNRSATRSRGPVSIHSPARMGSFSARGVEPLAQEPAVRSGAAKDLPPAQPAGQINVVGENAGAGAAFLDAEELAN